MRPDTSVSHSASRSSTSFRLARAAAAAAIALLAVSCHSDKTTAVCTVTTLAFTTQPANTAAGSAISVTVTARDGSGNTATCFKNTVTIALGTNPGAATLSGTTTATAVSGVATFTNLSLTKAANGYTLTANGGGASGSSSAFNITPGPASVLAFTTQPGSAVAGAAITTTVTARDQFGNTATGFTGNVAMTIGTNPGTGTLSGTTSVGAALGVASFTTLNINKVGTGYTLTAAAAGGAPPASATSTAFNITPGATSKLAITTPPANDSAGSPLSTVVVTAQDANDNTTPGFNGAVTVAITGGTGTAGAVLSGPKTVNAVAGLASFSTLSIDKPGTGYTLTATAGAITSTPSATFNIAVGSPSQLVFTQQPTQATAGAFIAPAITVTVQDAVGNTVTTFNSNVTLTIGTNPAGGTLSGTASVTAASGIATFTGLSIDKAGAGYVLTATAGAVSKQSSAFTISAAPPTQLVFTTQPVQTAAGATIPTVVVTAEDQFNNVATIFANPVTVAITGGTGKAGAALSGTKVITAAGGAATFATLSIDSVGTNYTLTATATGLIGGFASASFNIVPSAATVLVFTAQPSNKTAGLAIAPAVVVTARDAKGNTATGFVGNVAMAITTGTGTAGATLKGTTSVAVVAGIATFSNLRVDKSGAGYTITASSAGLTADTSTTFAITPGAATKVAFTAQPSLTTAGQSIAPAVQVTAQDSLGNADTAFAGSVTLTITAATGTAGAHLLNGGPVAVTAHTGIATFSTLNIDSAGANYTLSATGTGALTGVPSSPFNIKPGAATQLAFTAQPVTTTAGQPIVPAIKVTARDALGNTDTTFKTAITLAITPATGTSGAHLLNGVATAAAGVATFSTVSIDSTGANYTLTATGAAVAAATSGTFNIKPGGAVKLAFLVQPTSATAGPPATIPTVKVTAQDVLGNTDTLFAGNITVAIGANPGGGSLGGTLIVAAVKGVATYSDLSINKSGTGYKLQATSGALSPAASAFFDIIAGTATNLAFTVDPVITQAAPAVITPAVEVSGEDDHGNVDLTYTGSISIAIGTNPSSGVLTGTTPITAVNGVARFTNLAIDKVGNGYTLNATASLVTGTTSAAFDIIPNTVDHVVFTVGPSNATAGVSMNPAVVITAFDASNNVATQFTGGVTLSITPATGTTGAHLSHGSSVTVNAVAGVATFSTLSVDSAGTGYSLDVSGPATATSGTFNITPAPAAVLVFTAQPHTAVAGVSNAPAIVVTARDSVGNTATSFNGTTVNLSINTGPTGGTILSGGSATASLGVATFNALKNDKVGSYTLAASGGAVSTTVASSAYSITPAAASSFAFTGQPSNTVAAVAINPAIQLTARDPFGNTDTNYGSSVTLSISTNPGGGTIGGATQTASAGIVSFPNVTIDKVGNGYRLSASDGSISSAAPSGLFNITPAVATKLVFTTDPVTTTAGQTMATVAVAAEDPNGNIDTSYTGTITLAFANNPGGGGLGGTLIKVSPHGVGGGVVTFTDLSINVAQMGYKLQVTSGALAQGQSAAFNIVAASATQLAFIVQPDVIVTAGGNFHTPTGVRVAAEDQFGNIDSSFTGTVDMSLAGPTSTLLGTVHVAAVTGVASFPDLRIHPAGIDYTLTANFTGLVGNTSAQFDVRAAPADHMVFTTSPSDAVAGVVITPNVVVAARDTFDNLDSGFTANVTLSVNSGPAAVLQNAQVTPANGLATFTNFNVETAGGPRTLVATGGGITTPVPSGAFTITAAAANHLEFTQQPTNAVAGVAITPAIVVTGKDQFGNTDPAFDGGANDVTLSVNTGPAGTLNNAIATPALGVATFATFNVETVGTRTLKAAGGSIVSVPTGSSSFTISPAGADHFTFTGQPSDAVAGVSINPAITVEARDAFDNLATGFTGKDITLSISSGPGLILSGATATATGGVATFNAVSIDLAGAHTLDAINTVLGDCPTCTAGTSTSFNITHAAATKLGFVQEPGTTVHNVAISPAVAVAAQDPFGNTDPTFTGTVTISIGVNPASGVLSGTLSQAFGNVTPGVATFANLSIDNVGSGYRLLAVSSPILTQILSASFTIN